MGWLDASAAARPTVLYLSCSDLRLGLLRMAGRGSRGAEQVLSLGLLRLQLSLRSCQLLL